jgi:hypothetical protein
MIENTIILVILCLSVILLIRKVRETFSRNASGRGCQENCAGCRGSDITCSCSQTEQKDIDTERSSL